MRLRVIVPLAVLAIALAGCGGPKPAAPAVQEKPAPAFTRLLTIGNGDVVSVDPVTVKSDGTVVSLMLHFARRDIKNGVKSESWDVSFKPSERRVAIKAKMLYNEAGQVVSSDTAGGSWDYIAPDSDTEKIMQAVVDHCKSRGLALNATPPPYALPGFKYLAKSTANSAHYLYKPSSVRAATGQKSVEVLMINEAVHNGVKYSVSTVTFQTTAKKYQTTTQTLYDDAGRKTPAQGDARWYDVPSHSVYDMLMDEIK